MQHTSIAHLFFLATTGLFVGAACQVDADVSGGDGDVGKTVDTGRPDAGPPDVALYDAVRPDALPDAHPDAGIDASPPPLPPGCEPELSDQWAMGASCFWSDNLGPESFDVPFEDRAVVESVMEREPIGPFLPGTPALDTRYHLFFDEGFPVQCTAIGTTLPWGQGDEVWLETHALGQILSVQSATVSGRFRRGTPDAPVDVFIAQHGTDPFMTDTRADLAHFGLTLTFALVCPFVAWRWREFGYIEFPPDDPVLARELSFTFANGAGDTLTLRRGQQGEIALPDGRRARIALSDAREYHPDSPYVGLYHEFLLTIAP